MAQLDRASDYGSEGWGFESLRARYTYSLIESDIYLELLASPEAIEIVENKAKQING